MKVENTRLRAARERTESRAHIGEGLSRQELAEQVNTYVWDHHRQRVEIDVNYISKLERGAIRWPNARYREAFRAILSAATDSDLGFFNPRRAANPLRRGTDTVERTPPPEPAGRTVPRQLPPLPRLFTGRASELAALDTRSETTESTVTIWVIGGVGGIGKTSLALYWAHRHADQFPDGQLFVNLRGFAPTATPVPAAVAVRRFLDGLGVDPSAIPADVNAQIGLYRSLVADKRMLILLDNARDTAQVTPLLPGGSRCTVLVTSRCHLGGLVSTHGARAMSLDVFTEAEGRQLLTGHLGPDRVAAEPEAVTELMASCAGLPLAISIAAARAVRHPRFALAVLADKLRDHASRLDELDVGEADANLRSVFSWTYDALTPDAATLFTLLGLVPGLDISLSAAASLAALPEARADALLRELETAHLVQQPVPDRYRMHDLVHLYAAEQARRQPERTREAALRRLVDFYLHTARSADLLQNSQRPTITVDPPAPRCHPRSLSTVPAALTWMSTERLNLLAAQQLAADHQWHVPVWGLAWYMRTFLWRQGYLHDNLVTWRTAIGAADHIGDTAVRNLAHRHLGDAHLLLRQHATTFMHHQYALILAENAHDIPNQAHTHWGLAWAANERGNHQRALHHATQALRLYTTLDQPRREADALTTIGQCHIGLGNYHQAREYCRQAFTIFREHHHRIGEARTLDSLGLIELRAGQPIHAVDHYQHAIALFREFGFTYYEANALEKLGETHTALDQHHHAHIVWTRALALYETQHRTADAQRIRHHMRST